MALKPKCTVILSPPPWLALLHVLLVAVTTYHVLAFNTGRGMVSRTLGYNFHTVFMEDDPGRYTGDPADSPAGKRVFLFSPDDFSGAVSLMLSRYWALPSLAMLPVEIAPLSSSSPLLSRGSRSTLFGDGVADSAVPPPRVAYVYYGGDAASRILDPSAVPFNLAPVTDTLTLRAPNETFPLDACPNATALRGFFASLVSLRYTLPFRVRGATSAAGGGTPAAGGGDGAACEGWEIDMLYDFSQRGQFEVLWDYRLLGKCGGGHSGSGPGSGTLSSSSPTLQSVCILTLVLGVAHLALTAVTAATGLLSFSHARARLEWQHRLQIKQSTASSSATSTSAAAAHDATTLSRLSRWHALLLIDAWIAANEIGVLCVCVHAAGVVAAGSDIAAAPLDGVPLAAATALLWTGCLGHVSHMRRLYSNVLTLRDAAPSVIAFIIAPAPIFVAFALFGMVVFGHHQPRYATPTLAFSTLFSFYNGDALVETYEHTEDGARGDWRLTLTGDIFLVGLTLLFTYIVANCIVAVVESAFFANFSSGGGGGGGAVEEDAGRHSLRARVQRLVRQCSDDEQGGGSGVGMAEGG